tara:strand:- start:427 stop:864 length:438 start_codon:yes stop_codon:yes gene_type:complete
MAAPYYVNRKHTQAMSDLFKLKPSTDNIIYTVHHPVDDTLLLNDDGSLMTIELLSPHSEQFKQNQLQQLAKQIHSAATEDDYNLSEDNLSAATSEVLALATVSWTITFDDETPACTVAKAQEIYQEVHWLRYQLEAAVAHRMVTL